MHCVSCRFASAELALLLFEDVIAPPVVAMPAQHSGQHHDLDHHQWSLVFAYVYHWFGW